MKENILELAARLFDAHAMVGSYLILGLETRPDRDIDEFTVKNGNYQFIGYQRHFTPKIKELVAAIRKAGFFAHQVRYSEAQIKLLAVTGKIGEWGKNALVIHPRFGPRLRFVVLKTNIPFSSEMQDPKSLCISCANCQACLDICPTKALNPFKIPDKTKCLAYLDPNNPTNKRRCELCQSACPVGRK